jgi:FKBP-type peptidyl-prolyl cis-trans isomerase FkpA
MSVTTVPIQPIEKGSLVKLWGGVGLAALAALGLAWAGTANGSGDCGDKAFLDEGKGVGAPVVTASGLRFQTVKAGAGDKPTDSDVALLNYRGTLASTGAEFDANQSTPFPVQGTIPGFSEGMKLMQPGGSYRLCIPSKLAYGPKATPDGKIPANSTLLFEVDLLAKMDMGEFQSKMQAMQAQQQKQGGPGGPPPAAIPPGAGAPPTP